MRVRNEESGYDSKLHPVTTCISANFELSSSRSKFNASFEKKIENLWFQSRRLGWSYNDFVLHLLEVLVILQHRDSLKRPAASESGIATQ
jgi:hypothetical protein